MSTRTVITEVINEGTTPTLTFTIVDRLDIGFKPETLELTLFSYRDGTIINGRDSQDVLDLNDVATLVTGVTTFQMLAEDTIIVHSNSGLEAHIAYFEWTWNSGLFVGSHEIELHVQNLSKKI